VLVENTGYYAQASNYLHFHDLKAAAQIVTVITFHNVIHLAACQLAGSLEGNAGKDVLKTTIAAEHERP